MVGSVLNHYCRPLPEPLPSHWQRRTRVDQCAELQPSCADNTPHRDHLYCAYRQGIRSVSRDDGWKLICSWLWWMGLCANNYITFPMIPMKLNNLAAGFATADGSQSLRELLQHGHQDHDDQRLPEQWQGVPA